MKRVAALAIVTVISASSFAAAPTSSANKSSQNISALGGVWKTYRSLQPKDPSSKIEMVYGGEDLKNPALVQTARS